MSLLPVALADLQATARSSSAAIAARPTRAGSSATPPLGGGDRPRHRPGRPSAWRHSLFPPAAAVLALLLLLAGGLAACAAVQGARATHNEM